MRLARKGVRDRRGLLALEILEQHVVVGSRSGSVVPGRQLDRRELDADRLGQDLGGRAQIEDVLSDPLRVLGARVEILHDGREGEGHQGLGLHAVVEERRVVDLAAGQLGITGQPLREAAERGIEVPGSDAGEIGHRIGEMGELEIDERRDLAVREHQVPGSRIPLAEHGAHRLPGHVPPQPLADERHHRERLAHGPLVGRLPDVEVVERELFGRPRDPEPDRLEFPGVDRVQLGQPLEEALEDRLALGLVLHVVEVVAPVDVVEHRGLRIVVEGQHPGHEHPFAVEHLEDLRLASRGINARIGEESSRVPRT
jgi:hypothetical protein